MKLNIKLSKTKLIIICLSMITLIAGTTYAIITWNSNNTKLAGNTMCFDILYTKGQDINFGTVNSSGVVENGMTASLDFDESTSASTTVTFQRKPNCALYGIGTIKANISVSPANVTMSKGGLNYVIKNNNTSATVKTGTITSAGSTVIYDNFIINESITYIIYFWLDADYIDNTYLEATFSGTIESSAISTTEYGEVDEDYVDNTEVSLYNQLASNAVADNIASDYVTASTGIDFSAISSDTNGKGIYMLNTTATDDYPIYYYRGAVDNNLIFANFCWKIVRTTETGGIKLIYNGTPTNGKCNNTGTSTQIGTSAFNSSSNDNAYVGYMYGTAGASTYDATHKNTNNSAIKTTIDTWYASNMTSYTEKLEDTVWCNDRSIDTSMSGTGLGYGTNQTYYMAYNRLFTNKSPSLVCSQANDKFTKDTANGNGKLTYPVGLITLDEAAYAGGVMYIGNTNYYLFSGTYYFLGTPMTNISGAVGSGVCNSDVEEYNGSLAETPINGDTDGDFNATDVGVRPAVSLAPGTTFSGGSGSGDAPYIVS